MDFSKNMDFFGQIRIVLFEFSWKVNTPYGIFSLNADFFICFDFLENMKSEYSLPVLKKVSEITDFWKKKKKKKSGNTDRCICCSESCWLDACLNAAPLSNFNINFYQLHFFFSCNVVVGCVVN